MKNAKNEQPVIRIASNFAKYANIIHIKFGPLSCFLVSQSFFFNSKKRVIKNLTYKKSENSDISIYQKFNNCLIKFIVY
jgi:hypothetical protein